MGKREFEYAKLRGKIKEVFGTEKSFAAELGTTSTTISLILNNKAEFTQSAIIKSAEKLGIEPEQISDYFFTTKIK